MNEQKKLIAKVVGVVVASVLTVSVTAAPSEADADSKRVVQRDTTWKPI